MRILAISDLHGYLPDLKDYKTCDLLLIAGDLIPVDIQDDYKASENWFKTTFTEWANNIRENSLIEKILFIGGNHDKWLCNFPQKASYLFDLLGYVTYLQDMSYYFKGIHIYGTPWCTQFYDWSFMKENHELELIAKTFPKVVNILLCHDMPYTGINFGPNDSETWGNRPWRDYIDRCTPNIVIHGHFHNSPKHVNLEYTDIYNVSILNNNYVPTYKPIIIDYNG